MDTGEPLFHPWINKAIERAQTRVEDRNFEIRKHLLEYDDVLNEQRRFIYDQRDTILDDPDLKARILSSAEELVEDTLDEFRDIRGRNKAAAVAELAERMKVDFFYPLPYESEELAELPPDELQERIIDDFRADLAEKADKVGTEGFNQFIRHEYLRNIDGRWQEHLEGLEALREAVYLRSYAQKNPLLEYKLEGFEIFDKLIQNIKGELAKKVLKVKIQKYDQGHRQRVPAGVSANHTAMGQFAGGIGPFRRVTTGQPSGSHGEAKRSQGGTE